ncbi:MAG: hypothetical protein AAGF46_06835, partial [Pseudomonadota bacterium]
FRGGRGGIVFGNSVRSTKDLRKPVTITWQPLVDSTGVASLPPETTGVFVFRLDDGDYVLSPPVRADDAAAAVRLVLTGIAGTPPARKGEAIGLAGMSPRPVTRYHLEGGKVRVVDDAVGVTFYVHPAISRTTLAPVMLLADARPIIGGLVSQLKERVLLSQASEQVKDQLVSWLEMRKGNYKIIDVPMEVYEQGGVLSTRRFPSTLADAVASCDCFLSMQTFDAEGNPRLEQEEPVSFSSILPVMLEHLPEFRRLNELARQMALLRWATANDAAWIGDIAVEQAKHSITSFYVASDNEFEFGVDPDEEAFILAQRVERASRALLESSKAPAALRDLDADVASYRRKTLALAAIERVIVSANSMFYLSPDDSVEFAKVWGNGGNRALIVMDDEEFADYTEWAEPDAEILEQVTHSRELFRPIAAEVEADTAVLQARWDALREGDPLRDGLTSVAARLFELESDRRAAFEQGIARDQEMRDLLARLEIAAKRPRSASDEVELRLAFASDAERAALQPRLDEWREALEGWYTDDEKLARELLPRLRQVEDAAIDDKLRELRHGIEQAAFLNDVPGLSRWWMLQRSYREQCIVQAECVFESPFMRALFEARGE